MCVGEMGSCCGRPWVAKRLAPAEEFLLPEDKNMTPNVTRLFDIMFHPSQ